MRRSPDTLPTVSVLSAKQLSVISSPPMVAVTFRIWSVGTVKLQVKELPSDTADAVP